MKKMIPVVLLALATVSVTACNTIGGAGKDVERAGEKIQDASKK